MPQVLPHREEVRTGGQARRPSISEDGTRLEGDPLGSRSGSDARGAQRAGSGGEYRSRRAASSPLFPTASRFSQWADELSPSFQFLALMEGTTFAAEPEGGDDD